jgi:hypothetical protein
MTCGHAQTLESAQCIRGLLCKPVPLQRDKQVYSSFSNAANAFFRFRVTVADLNVFTSWLAPSSPPSTAMITAKFLQSFPDCMAPRETYVPCVHKL